MGSRWARVVAYGLLPALTVVLGGGAGVLTWEVISAHLLESARVDSVRAAQDGAAAILTYRPDTVDADLGAARDRLTGKFKDSYTLFTHQTVIPDATAEANLVDGLRPGSRVGVGNPSPRRGHGLRQPDVHA